MVVERKSRKETTQHVTTGMSSKYVLRQKIDFRTGAPAVGDAELVYGPNIKGIYDAAWYSTLYFLKLCDIYQDSLDLELMAQVKTVLENAVEARNVVLASHPLLCT